MGYRDMHLKLSKNQAVGADANSTDHIDTSLSIPGWERGMPAAVIVNCEVACGGTTGINFIVCHKVTEPTVNDANLVSVTVPTAQIVAGWELVIPLPTGIPLLKMVRLYYDLINGNETNGTFSAYFTPLPGPITA